MYNECDSQMFMNKLTLDRLTCHYNQSFNQSISQWVVSLLLNFGVLVGTGVLSWAWP